ncbi:MAG: tyrosine-type recombinase/integrase [Planctomycetota bacterium]|nr:tyrosine-type recombinase/integrase [Planctomycetota bacterium]
MSSKSISSAVRRKASNQNGWTPPYDDFPLSFHPPSGRLYKKILGRRRYFGYADNWQDAIEKFQRERDDLYAGREPSVSVEGLTVKDLCNHFLTNKKQLVASGELTTRSFSDYQSTTDRLVKVFGKHRAVHTLNGTDFAKLRANIAKTRGAVALKNEMVRAKCVFNFAFKDELIDRPIRYGAGFETPKRKVIRKASNAKGSRMFEASELRTIVDAADVHLKAMILLAANSGMGNNDIGCLPLSAVNFATGWVDFPREKTGTPRRFPLWPETTEAIKASLAKRPTPRPGHEQYLFLTRKRQCWSKDSTGGTLSREFKKLLDDTKLYRDGLGFYCLRRGFQTIGEEAGETATKFIMGHVDTSMSAQYRQRIGDDRLQAVVDHVRGWLFGAEGVSNG